MDPAAAPAPVEPRPPPTPLGGAALRTWGVRALRAAVTVAATWWVVHRLPAGELGSISEALPRWTLAMPSAVMAVNTMLLAERHRTALAALGHAVPLGELVLLHLRSAFAALVLPRGGADLTRVAVLARQTGDLEGVLAAALHLRVVDLGLWIGLLVVFLLQGPWPGLRALELAAAAVIGAGIGILVALPVGVRLAGDRVGRLPWIGARALRIVEALRAAAGAGRATLRIAALGLPMALGNIASVSVLFWAAGVEIPLPRQIGLVPAMDAVLSLPITVGGVGLRESVFILVGESFGIAAPAALAIAWTRWTGELSRGLVGGLSLWISGGWGQRRQRET
ncbi:MAG: flippase-like domain-containing protein [Deltaproteobacteria bacterium]|nr:flippase-like domain-containing protein [Deltaproteobacteria bacterium]